MRWPCSVYFAVIVLTLCCAGEAHANTTLVGPDAARYQPWIDASLVPTATENLTLISALCPADNATPACTTPATASIWYLPTLWTPGWALRHIFMHEIGHRFDYALMTTATRQRFGEIVHDQRPWYAAGNSPVEKFAETYALCSMHLVIRRAQSLADGLRIGPVAFGRACALIRAAAITPAGT